MDETAKLILGKQGHDDVRPRELLRAITSRVPLAWQAAEKIRAAERKCYPDWPDWCYLPVSRWETILVSYFELPRDSDDLFNDAAILAAFGIWRLGQGVYRFDTDLKKELTATKMTGNLPSSVFFRLPEWCIYIENPTPKMPGAFVHLDHYPKADRNDLRILLDRGNTLQGIALGLGDWSIETAITKTRNTIFANQYEPMIQLIEPIVSLTLYICSSSADYAGDNKPSHPQSVKTKKGPRVFCASSPRVWDVGVRLGSALRRAYAELKDKEPESTHASPRPHIRRAHWHTYRVGLGKTDLRLKWLPPIPVNVGSYDELPAVIYSEKK